MKFLIAVVATWLAVLDSGAAAQSYYPDRLDWQLNQFIGNVLAAADQ